MAPDLTLVQERLGKPDRIKSLTTGSTMKVNLHVLLESLDALAHGAALGAEQPHQLGPGGGGASRHWLLPLDGLFLVTSAIGRSQIYPCQKFVTLLTLHARRSFARSCHSSRCCLPPPGSL